MILTTKQEQGLKIAVERFRNGEKYTCIAGYAGTGKSTLIKFIIEALGVDPATDVCYVAFTGKAATVLQSKGCTNATTAHQLLYHAKPMPNGAFKFIKKDNIDYKVVVVDEISMLPKPMWESLMRHNVYVLATGDPGQLPPIYESMDNQVLDNPHIFLDEIMRQAQDSEIIRLSMWVRAGRPLISFPGTNEQVRIVSPAEAVDGMYSWADQILCATNEKCNQINTFMRKNLGFGPLPNEKDKIISLDNHWQYFSSKGTWALTNGAIGTIKESELESVRLPYYISHTPIQYLYTDILLEDGEIFHRVPIDYNSLIKGEPSLTPAQVYQLNKNEYLPDAPFEFAYAYAITCHKAQGSEWDKVLVIEDKFPTGNSIHSRWLYTATTRAKEKLVIVRK